MAVEVPGGILSQSDVRETVTNTEETGVLFNLAYGRFKNLYDTNKGIEGLYVSQDGLHMYITYDEAGASTIGEWTFGTRWDITTITETIERLNPV